MSETPAPELGEPSANLKDEFRTVIEGVVIDGSIAASFTIEDGRVLELSVTSPTEGDNGSGSFNATFSQTIQGVQGVNTRHVTYYHLYQDGNLVKSIETEEGRPPAHEASMDQLKASARTRVQELEAMGRQTSEARMIAALELGSKRKAVLDEVGYDPATALFDDMLADRDDRDLGLDQVSGAELQRVVDEIKSALATK